MNCLRSLGSWDRGFDSHTKHGCLVCVCVYSMSVLSCVYIETLRRADHSSKESYRLQNDHETEKAEGRTQGGCRASEKYVPQAPSLLKLENGCGFLNYFMLFSAIKREALKGGLQR
jgi:hypothetical protein